MDSSCSTTVMVCMVPPEEALHRLKTVISGHGREGLPPALPRPVCSRCGVEHELDHTGPGTRLRFDMGNLLKSTETALESIFSALTWDAYSHSFQRKATRFLSICA